MVTAYRGRVFWVSWLFSHFKIMRFLHDILFSSFFCRQFLYRALVLHTYTKTNYIFCFFFMFLFLNFVFFLDNLIFWLLNAQHGTSIKSMKNGSKTENWIGFVYGQFLHSVYTHYFYLTLFFLIVYKPYYYKHIAALMTFFGG